MIALLLCLVPILTPGFGRTFDHFNSTLALPNPHSRQDDTVVCTPSPDGFPVFVPHPHDCTKYYECQGDWPILMECPAGLYFDPALNVCNWPEEVDCVAKCSVQLVFADISNLTLTTWSPEENCQVQNFKGFPSIQSAFPVDIHQCSNGLTVITSQFEDSTTQLFAYNAHTGHWELIALPSEISNANSYAIAAIPDPPPRFDYGLLLVGGKVDERNGTPKPLDTICGFNCSAYVSNKHEVWTCFPRSQYKLCTPAYDSCATSSNDFVTVINGKKGQSDPNKEVGFYPAMGKPPKCRPNTVDFNGGVQDCISPKPAQVYAIGTEKMYGMNPAVGSVKLLKGHLPVTPTEDKPARLYFTPENSLVNIIGGIFNGEPSCITYFYEHDMWNANPGKKAPCGKNVRVLGRL